MKRTIVAYFSFLIAIFGMGISFCADKVLIMTYAHSRPDFIALHAKTLQVFFKDDYEYVVFNDAPSDSMRKQIEQMCQSLGVRCFRVPDHKPDRQSPNSRHCDGIRYSLELLGFEHDGIVMMIDADMFLVRPFSASEYLKEYDFVGGYQFRSKGSLTVVYTSPCLVFMDMRKLPNKRTISFESGRIEGLSCDTGASTYYYFKNNNNIRLKFYTAVSVDFLPLNRERLRELGYDENSINLLLTINRIYGFEFHGGNDFLHYYAGGSNWPGYSQQWIQEKNYLLNHFIEQQMEFYKPTITKG